MYVHSFGAIICQTVIYLEIRGLYTIEHKALSGSTLSIEPLEIDRVNGRGKGDVV